MKLTSEQKRAVCTIDRNLQLIACAGSGKTEVITRRIANILTSKPDVRPEQIVAFTFTNKAADSMKARIQRVLEGSALEDAGERMYIGTIHAFCKQLLNRYSDTFQDYRVLDTVKTHLFVERYSHECGLETLGLSRGLNDIKLFCTCVEKLVDDYGHRSLWPQKQQDALEQYRSALYSHRFLDFSLLLLETMEQIRGNPQEYLKTIRYLIVDEYQDVDDLQEKLIASIAAAGANICVVGDDDQTIYQFRGSNAGNMIGFAQRYPDVVQIRLEDNFRCAPAIVDIADTVIRRNEERLDKKMRSQRDAAGSLAAVRRYCDAERQYRGIAEEITVCHENRVPYSEIAILVRKSKYIDAICRALDEKHIPYYTDSAQQFFQGRYFSRFVQTLSMLADVDKAKLYECWRGVLREDRLNAGFRYLRRAARSGGDGYSLPLSGILWDFAELAGFLEEGVPDCAAREDGLSGIAVILDDYDAIYGDWQLSARVSGVLRFLEERAAEEYKYHNFQGKNTAEDAVQIMTIHKSKGLEFHTVFLPNLQKGEFPSSNRGGKQYWHILEGRLAQNRERYENSLEDERKLFYVAVTRAKKQLYLCWEDSKRLLSIFAAEAAQSPVLDRGDLCQEEIDIVLYDIDINAVRELILEKVYAGAYSGLGGLFIEADEIRRASPVEIVRYAKEYNVPLV